MSLADALALGPGAWNAVMVRSESPSPFMSWAWHRAWADAAPPGDVDASDVLLLRARDGAPQAILPVLERRMTFRRVPMDAATWDAYLATLSPTRRQTVRRKERSLSRLHRVALTDYTEERFDEGWSHLVRLHEERWQGEGGGAFRGQMAVAVPRAV